MSENNNESVAIPPDLSKLELPKKEVEGNYDGIFPDKIITKDEFAVPAPRFPSPWNLPDIESSGNQPNIKSNAGDYQGCGCSKLNVEDTAPSIHGHNSYAEPSSIIIGPDKDLPPEMHGYVPWNGYIKIPEPAFGHQGEFGNVDNVIQKDLLPEDPDFYNETVEPLTVGQFIEAKIKIRNMGKYRYHGHDDDDVCKLLDKSVWDMQDPNRPIIPFEKAGIVNTHPNCKCTWEYFTEVDPDSYSSKRIKKPVSGRGRPLSEEARKKLSLRHLRKVDSIIQRKFKAGTLHKIDDKGRVTDDTFGETIHRIAESIEPIRHEFEWLSDEYLEKVKSLPNDGEWYLIRASAETITDHRGEGEPYPRLLSGRELMAMARTAVGHGMDVNHLGPKFSTEAYIADSEYDDSRSQIQMLVYEGDPLINQAIDQGIITAVSINGGAPRETTIEPCDHPAGQCVVPKGVILGENDGIALTWVVTDPRGFHYKDTHLPAAEPGVKTTAIQRL